MTEINKVKCRTCLNMVENPTDPWEKGYFIVYSDYHGTEYLKTFDWCRSKGCITKSKKQAKYYRQELFNDATQFFKEA